MPKLKLIHIYKVVKMIRIYKVVITLKDIQNSIILQVFN